jgi:DNA-binding XRE family transcriptional regulator
MLILGKLNLISINNNIYHLMFTFVRRYIVCTLNNVLMPKSLIFLGLKVKNQRNSLGLSQEELAERTSLDRTYISLLERGKRNPSLLTLMKVAEGLEISVSILTKDIENSGSSSD